MERREEHALNEVDRIGVTVEYLRDLLVAARAAERRANQPGALGERPPD